MKILINTMLHERNKIVYKIKLNKKNSLSFHSEKMGEIIEGGLSGVYLPLYG